MRFFTPLALLTASLTALVTPLVAAKREVVVYYADWSSANMPPETIQWSKITRLNYAFVVLDGEQNMAVGTPELLTKVVTLAHQNKVKVNLAIGGWTGSGNFSNMVATEATRSRTITNMLALVDQYNLDGLDVDWEYPGRMGAPCNIVDEANDSPNFLIFLNALRAALDTKYTPAGSKLITMAVRVDPFDVNGAPMTDVSAFAKSIDFIQVMAYDIYGAFSPTTGPNAPFQCDVAQKGQYSYVQSIQAWIAAGFPANKIIAGLPFYGRAMQAAEAMDGTTQYVPQVKTVIAGDKDDAVYQSACLKDPAQFSTVWKYRQLRAQGLVNADNTAGAGWTRYWDETSKTPWLYNAANKTMISYDDTQSITIKVQWALGARGTQTAGLPASPQVAGVQVWELSQDNGELLDSINKAISGLPRPKCKPRKLS
ncbi:hypothetical protein IWQ60_005181 [Tieghemiomyces parasiticus]|uniref:GH18 domain-containing protein n=1 Tax=Tieghemiomyces parasiticus TaxID=78921 RepID=A0A9W8ACV1_9FUNG|nr:hypothetical protein IWQ60_005181 [Tieghemiomyces parasiticus]